MDLKISQQPALLGLNINKPAVELSIQPPRSDVTAVMDQVEIEATDPKVTIDLIACHEDAGYFKPLSFMGQLSQKSFSKGLDAIADIVALGNSLADIGSGVTIQSIVTSKDRAESQQDFNVTAIPKHAPVVKANIIPLKLGINEGEYGLDFTPGDVINSTNWANVEMYLLQKPSIDVQWTGSYFDAIA